MRGNFQALKQSFLAWFLLLLLAFIWGSSFILMYESLFDSQEQPLFNSWQVGAMRIALAGFVLLPVVVFKWKKISLRDYGWMAAVGIVGNTIPAFSFTYAQTTLDSNFAGILNGLTPFWALLIGALLFRAVIKRIQFFGILIGLIGAIGLITMNEIDGSISIPHVVVVVIATACYGLSVNMIHHKLAHLHSATIAAFALMTGGVPCAIYALNSGAVDVIRDHPEGWLGFGAVAILGIVGTALALVLFNRLIQMTGSVFATSVTYLMPVVALFWGVLYHERITGMHVLWSVVIFSGVYLTNKGKASGRRTSAAVE